MSRIEVFYLETKIGEVSDAGTQTSFCFSPEFLGSGIELSPLAMKLRREPYVYSSEEFDHLPPLLHDCLPDHYGRSVMRRWFALKFGAGHRPSAAEKLGYVGKGGLGALMFRPVLDGAPPDTLRELDLRQQEKLSKTITSQDLPELVQKVKMAAKTVGGRFPKALVAIDPKTGFFYEDDPRLSADYERWIIKFGVPPLERDSLNNHPNIEHAYSLMAQAAAIRVPRTKLFASSSNYSHFGSERFDVHGGTRLHVATLSALTEVPAGRLELDYRDLFAATLALTKDLAEVEQAFRRMVFNVVAHNVDDHGKNHSFLFDGGRWRLAPAYDVSFADVSAIDSFVTVSRAMPVNGNPINPRRKDFVKLGERFGLSRSRGDTIIEEVTSIVSQISSFLEEAGVEDEAANSISKKVEQVMAEARGPGLRR